MTAEHWDRTSANFRTGRTPAANRALYRFWKGKGRYVEARLRHLGSRLARRLYPVELVAVLAILGILVALALPRYLGNRRQAYRAEAQALLEEVKGLEFSYFMDHGNCFTSNVVGLGFVMPGGSHWSFPTATSNGNGALCAGTGQGQGQGNLGFVTLTMSGALSPMSAADQVSVTLLGDGSVTAGANF